ncbi:MAG: hypothetical protein A3E00_17815 [Curvibacter sp. RIFCSPHIGHO2_12_FULL_63_18]|nr:MAG: hypothetical protein A2037_00280 [Curvibacter sp. GWA2_63_95]OGP05708.1 MAG: hypothetical protein A3E00_17815 [Curvibacter sp. RIFCSPHIGHO2_12_FULL_63_18]HCX81597.1 hypothetical protein [Rhodoferax sp.]
MRPTVPRYLLSLLTGIFIALFATPALATRQCPPEFGEKSVIVLIVGWAVVATGFVVGSMLMRYVFLRSRNRTWLSQTLILLTGMAGMFFAWFLGLLVAFNGFFLTC